MCKVRDIETCEKRVCIYLESGEMVSSEWFFDDERKNTYGVYRFTELEKKAYDELIHANSITDEKIDHWAVARNKGDEDSVYVSRHAFDRMKERNGWNKKTSLRMVRKIFDEGMEPKDVPGQYKAWAIQKSKKNPECLFKFYGQMLYVFDNKVLITVMKGTKLKFDSLRKEGIRIWN